MDRGIRSVTGVDRARSRAERLGLQRDDGDNTDRFLLAILIRYHAQSDLVRTTVAALRGYKRLRDAGDQLAIERTLPGPNQIAKVIDDCTRCRCCPSGANINGREDLVDCSITTQRSDTGNLESQL